MILECGLIKCRETAQLMRKKKEKNNSFVYNVADLNKIVSNEYKLRGKSVHY
jgi:hypothetical protein